jgi:hypothetical protein
LQAQVGVGIVFQADSLGALAVKSLAVGGDHGYDYYTMNFAFCSFYVHAVLYAGL